MSQVTRSLTPELIRQLLERSARTERSSEYVRLMEIYCVVKAGGVSAQIAAARQLEEKERLTLRQEMALLIQQADPTNRVQALEQEVQEVERSVSHRIAFLKNINPQEEANVRSCLPLIDDYFASLKKTL